MNRNHRSAGALALAVLAAALGAGGAPAQDEKRPLNYPDSLNFNRGLAPFPSGAFSTFLRQTAEDKQGRTVARGAYYTTHGVTCRYVRYPDLREGDLVPVRGEVYRVSGISAGRVPSMNLDKLPVDQRPRGIAPAHDSFTIPLSNESRAVGQIGYAPNRWISVHVVEAKGPAKEGEKPTARLRLEDTGLEGGTTSSEAAVKQGDVLLLRSRGYKVRAVVPADAKTRLIGWVEFAPEAVAEKDLVAKKTPFVRPARPKKE